LARTRTTKKLAQRIDLNYFKRPTPLKRAKLWLSILLPLLALVWIAERTLTKDSRVYSSGRMSEPHAVLEKECSACHVQQAGAFSAKATDSACLACHDGPMHHATTMKSLECAACHIEHRGRIGISAASNQSCAECHSHLRTGVPSMKYAPGIRSFEDGHPEFMTLRWHGGIPPSAPATIKLNHAIHMQPIRRGPNGPMVQLQCSDCHRPAAVPAPTTYSDANYVGAGALYVEDYKSIPHDQDLLVPRRPATGRELMSPVKYANACAACHLLSFDKLFEIGVPHDKPEIVHAFLITKFGQYIAAHPNEVRVSRDPSRDRTGRPNPPEIRVLTPAQWVAERTTEAEELLWRKTCKQCHTLSFGEPNASNRLSQSLTTDVSFNSKLGLPYVAPAAVRLKWMPHANFDHDAHQGFSCGACHEKALTSTESSDVLIPGIANCQTCHAPGPDHAESRCFECHTYHDWSKRKEITLKFTLPELQHGGR
jgi:hypothetical protein